MSIALSQYKDRDRILIIENGRLNNNLPFTRSSTATYLNGANTIVTASNDMPRYEYSAAGAYLGLLMEETRTNLLLNSDGTVAQISPNSGVTDATTALASYFTNSIQFPATSGTTNYAYKQANATNGNIYMLSVFVKMNDASLPSVNGGSTAGDFSLVVLAAAVTNSVVTSMGGGVYRISSVQTATATVVTNFGVVQYSTQSQKAFRVTGYQLEQIASTSSAMCSYIPTTTASVTRSADVVQATLSTIGISTTAGTFVIEHDVPTGQPLLYSGSNKILDSTGAGKVAIAYDGSGIVTSVNGAATTTGAALTFSTTLDVAKSSTTSANAHIKRLVWYNTKRAAAELQALST